MNKDKCIICGQPAKIQMTPLGLFFCTKCYWDSQIAARRSVYIREERAKVRPQLDQLIKEIDTINAGVSERVKARLRAEREDKS